MNQSIDEAASGGRWTEHLRGDTVIRVPASGVAILAHLDLVGLILVVRDESGGDIALRTLRPQEVANTLAAIARPAW